MNRPPPSFPREEVRLREAATRILQAALAAVDPETLVCRILEEGSAKGRLRFGAGETQRIRLVSVGKAAFTMARGAVRALGEDGIVSGIVLTPEGTAGGVPLPEHIRVYEGGHPLPTPGGMEGARAIHAFLSDRVRAEPVLFLLSGGGSALLALPRDGISLGDLRETTELLLRAGATIHELNTVRKHLEEAKGGGLARAASGVPILALLISDVIGDPLDVIASGPLTPDPTTFSTALEALDRYGLRGKVPPDVLAYLEEGEAGGHPESPKAGDPCFATVDIQVIGSLSAAAQGAMVAAAAEGYDVHTVDLEMIGEAREVGRRLGELGRSIRGGTAEYRPPVCLIFGGETTVTVTGGGKGGRNQELALGAASALHEIGGVLLASMGTDGIDGPTDAAGALVTGSTLRRARAANIDAEAALRENASYSFFQSLDDLILTGPTGTNVMDLQVVLVE